jgi:hypothetical protein
MQSTVTFTAYAPDGTVTATKTTRHANGFRLDTYANNEFPYDKVGMQYADNNDLTAVVKNAEGRVIATFLQIKDAPDAE